jgi:hypothetical protein
LQRLEAANVAVKGQHDVVVLLVHMLLVERGFEPAANAASGDLAANSLGVPPGWNAASGAYGLTYTHEKVHNHKVTLKCLAMGQTLSAHFVVEADDPAVAAAGSPPTVRSHDFCVDDFACARGAVRSAAVDTLRRAVMERLVSPLLPVSGDAKAASADRAPSQVPGGRAPRGPSADAGAVERRPERPGRGAGFLGDLDPFSGAMGPGGGSVGGGLGGPAGSRGGMLVGPQHPLFGGGGGPGRMGGLPAGVPPGARFDPFGPGRGPGFGGGGGRFGGGRGGRGGRGFMGPGPDHLEPPGMGGGLGGDMDMSFM